MSRHPPLIYDLRVTDAGTGAWRLVRLSSGATLTRLQRVIGVVFGWRSGTTMSFEVGHLRFPSMDPGTLDRTHLRQVLTGRGDRMDAEYRHARGDGTLAIDVEHVLPASDGIVTPSCLGGADPLGDGAEDASGAALPVSVAAINAELLQLRRGP